jgi:ankyrin repeat protein
MRTLFLAVLGLAALCPAAATRSGDFSLYHAAQAGDAAQVSDLLAAGAEVDLPIHIDTPLHAAATAGHADAAALLIDAGANLERFGVLGTPLHVAATAGHIDVVRLLIAKGADLEAITYGGTPLAYAADQGHADIVAALISAGAEMDGGDEGHRPIVVAARAGYFGIVRLLVSVGADVRLIDGSSCDYTALHYVAEQGDLAMARELLQAGADPNSRGTKGETPITLASRRGNHILVALLTSLQPHD